MISNLTSTRALYYNYVICTFAVAAWSPRLRSFSTELWVFWMYVVRRSLFVASFVRDFGSSGLIIGLEIKAVRVIPILRQGPRPFFVACSFRVRESA